MVSYLCISHTPDTPQRSRSNKATNILGQLKKRRINILIPQTFWVKNGSFGFVKRFSFELQLARTRKIIRKNAVPWQPRINGNILKKPSENARKTDLGILFAEYPGSFEVLADKGYQGFENEFRAIHSSCQLPHAILSLTKLLENDKIAHDGVNMENYFGKLCTLWTVISSKYRREEQIYDAVITSCVSLSNEHIKRHPLCEMEGSSY